jgi:hypothetical protein
MGQSEFGQFRRSINTFLANKIEGSETLKNDKITNKFIVEVVGKEQSRKTENSGNGIFPMNPNECLLCIITLLSGLYFEKCLKNKELEE